MSNGTALKACIWSWSSHTNFRNFRVKWGCENKHLSNLATLLSYLALISRILFTPVTHEALMHCLHLFLSLALLSCSSLVSFCVYRPSHCFWSSNFRPLSFRLPRQCSGTNHVVVHTWPIHLHLFCIIISLAFIVLALLRNSLFDMVSGHLVLNICLRHLFWNGSTFFLSCSVQVSLPKLG